VRKDETLQKGGVTIDALKGRRRGRNLQREGGVHQQNPPPTRRSCGHPRKEEEGQIGKGGPHFRSRRSPSFSPKGRRRPGKREIARGEEDIRLVKLRGKRGTLRWQEGKRLCKRDRVIKTFSKEGGPKGKKRSYSATAVFSPHKEEKINL